MTTAATTNLAIPTGYVVETKRYCMHTAAVRLAARDNITYLDAVTRIEAEGLGAANPPLLAPAALTATDVDDDSVVHLTSQPKVEYIDGQEWTVGPNV